MHLHMPGMRGTQLCAGRMLCSGCMASTTSSRGGGHTPTLSCVAHPRGLPFGARAKSQTQRPFRTAAPQHPPNTAPRPPARWPRPRTETARPCSGPGPALPRYHPAAKRASGPDNQSPPKGQCADYHCAPPPAALTSGHENTPAERVATEAPPREKAPQAAPSWRG